MGIPRWLLLIDADDTLWESALFFHRAEEDFLNLMTSLGFDRTEVHRTVQRRDIERLSVTGYGARPYIDTLNSIMRECVDEPPAWAVTSLEDIGKCLLGHPVVLTPGVEETLSSLALLPVYSVVYTMGEEDHQRDKFLKSGLESRVSELTIVPEKTRVSLQKLLLRIGTPAERTLFVGNSPRSDINPATSLGIRSIYLHRKLTWTAEHEEFSHPDLVREISSFNDLLGIVRDFVDAEE